MEQISAEINQLNTKIDAIEVLLKKPFKDWSEEATNVYGIEEQEARKQLREERKQLRKEKEQLNELLILKEKEKLGTAGILC
jgi:low affinity Fe/Cu permease